MNKLCKKILSATIAGAMVISTLPISTGAISYDFWSTHYTRYNSHTIDDVYVSYYSEGFKAMITGKGGGYANYVSIRYIRSNGNTSLLLDMLTEPNKEAFIGGDWVEPIAGSVHFTVTLNYQTNNPNETISNDGKIRINN